MAKHEQVFGSHSTCVGWTRTRCFARLGPNMSSQPRSIAAKESEEEVVDVCAAIIAEAAMEVRRRSCITTWPHLEFKHHTE